MHLIETYAQVVYEQGEKKARVEDIYGEANLLLDLLEYIFFLN